MEVYSLGLYLMAQFYLREAHKADTADSWPSDLFSMQQEPSSPMHMTAKSWGREQCELPLVLQAPFPGSTSLFIERAQGHFGVRSSLPCQQQTQSQLACLQPRRCLRLLPAAPAHRAHLPMMRQHLQEHLALQEALLQGFSGFITRHSHALVALVLDPHATQQQQQQPGSPPQQQQQQQQRAAPPPPDGSQRVSAAELDRLSFLLRPSQGDGEEGGTSRRLEGGSPMDVCCTPFTGADAGYKAVLHDASVFFCFVCFGCRSLMRVGLAPMHI